MFIKVGSIVRSARTRGFVLAVSGSDIKVEWSSGLVCWTKAERVTVTG